MLTRMDALRRDVCHAVRSLGAARSFTLVALAVLTLSIGSTTAIFSVVDGVCCARFRFPMPTVSLPSANG